MKFCRLILVCVAAAAVAACSKGSAPQGAGPESAAPHAALTNPTDFPLDPAATVLDVEPFKQTISASSGSNAASGLLSQGAGTYVGNGVIAQASISMDDAQAWLKKTEGAPPAGYTLVTQTQNATAKSLAAKYGITYVAFHKGSKAALVAVLDPKVAHQKLGGLIGLVDKYRGLPQAMRDPIDAQVKQRAGVSISELTDPSGPLGMTLTALHKVQDNDQPAFLLVDVSKQ